MMTAAMRTAGMRRVMGPVCRSERREGRMRPGTPMALRIRRRVKEVDSGVWRMVSA